MDKIREALDRARRERSALAPASGDGRTMSAADLRPLRPALADAEASSAHLGAIPSARTVEPQTAVLEANRVLIRGASGRVADEFRLLRTQILDRMHERNWNTIGIISPRAGDGKTTIAANLAITITSDPRHTALLVDLDLSSPGVGPLFGLTVESGVENVLRGEASVESCLVRLAGFDGLRILPAVSAMNGSAGLVNDTRCRALVAELKGRYANRVILFDVPPVLDADDALLIAPQLDCLLLVVSEGRTTREDIVRTLELTHRTPVVGTVLNQVRDTVGTSRR